jgi:hypothetical protein
VRNASAETLEKESDVTPVDSRRHEAAGLLVSLLRDPAPTASSSGVAGDGTLATRL